MIGIYKIQNLINGKVYIGQSIDITSRFQSHKYVLNLIDDSKITSRPLYLAMKKYGVENFSFTVLEECNIEQLNEKEIMYIKKYNSYINAPNSNGYNLTPGGDSSTIDESIINECIILWQQGYSIKQIKDKTHLSHNTIEKYLKLKTTSYNTEESLKRREQGFTRYNVKSILQYTMKGEYVETYPSIADAARTLKISYNNIKQVVNNNAITIHNYIFIFNDQNKDKNLKLKLTQINKEISSRKHNLTNAKIQQYDINGNFIKTFNSINEAAEEVKRKPLTIRDGCYHKKLVAGFQWKFESDDKIITPYNKTPPNAKYIAQYSQEGELINIFRSGVEAGIALNIKKPTHIYNCCSGTRNKAYNYVWKYSTQEEYNKFHEI